MKSVKSTPQKALQSVEQAYIVFRKKLVQIQKKRRKLIDKVLQQDTDKKIEQLKKSIATSK
ncbi:MAG: hypothetical protein HYV41_04470 [Candidatus Magasanikbacteria bacterium]|nr:hypothetical protein [Candidatus Magasanikbacteria bacterium]